jgi:hypothetical protein
MSGWNMSISIGLNGAFSPRNAMYGQMLMMIGSTVENIINSSLD